MRPTSPPALQHEGQELLLQDMDMDWAEMVTDMMAEEGGPLPAGAAGGPTNVSLPRLAGSLTRLRQMVPDAAECNIEDLLERTVAYVHGLHLLGHGRSSTMNPPPGPPPASE